MYFQKYVLFKITYFQKYVLSKICTFQNYVLSKIRTFQKYVLFKITSFFSKFRTFQKIPHLTKVRREFPVFPRKIPCFSKFPVRKKLTFDTKFRVFSKKFRVLQNSPVFRFLNIKKHTHKTSIFV